MLTKVQSICADGDHDQGQIMREVSGIELLFRIFLTRGHPALADCFRGQAVREGLGQPMPLTSDRISLLVCGLSL